MILQELLHSAKIKKIANAYKVKRMGLFGSYATGRQHSQSDVDLLVEFAPQADLLDQVGLKLELEEILKKKVDVVTSNSLSKYFRKKVEKEVVYL